MTTGMVILAEYTPWLMEMKAKIERIAVCQDKSIQFRLSRNLFTLSLSAEELRHEYLYIVLGDLCTKAELGSQIQYIRNRYPYVKIIGIRKISDDAETPEAGIYSYRKKGVIVGWVQVIEENDLEPFFEEEMKQIEAFAEKVSYQRTLDNEREEKIKNEQERIS